MNSADLITSTQDLVQRALITVGPKAAEIDLKFGLTLSGETKYWCINNGTLSHSLPGRQTNSYEISTSKDFWSRYIAGKITYDSLAFGGHIRIFQGKKGYSSTFHRILRGIHSDINLKQLSDSISIPKETMIRFFNGKKIVLQRFCPHQGYDLLDVQIDRNGLITCPAHAWKFDCLTGRCVRGDHTSSL